ncbi:unnamed protein product [Leptidea sinapis]|uniref:Uncharacterized protein n=1 Tax=Leptidea sinapis TaxID=189913 RepID=A0A5E4QB31_9NEOP|nr:unnamed protein product [Leptidea sinapis]
MLGVVDGAALGGPGDAGAALALPRLPTQVCAFATKKTPFVISPLFDNTSLKASSIIGILGLKISSHCQFPRQYFKPGRILALYKAQVRPLMEYCCHLWSGAPQYMLDPFDRVQRRAARIVGDPSLHCDIIPTISICGGPPQSDFQGAFLSI